MYYDPVGARARYDDLLREAETNRLIGELRRQRNVPMSRMAQVRMRFGDRLGMIGRNLKRP